MNESTASMIQAAAEDGHTVGLRTNPSRNYETISDKDAIYSDLDHQVSYIEDVSGEKVQFARSPLNSSNMPNEYVYDYFVENNIIMTQSAFSPYDAGTNPTEAVENHFRLLSPSFDSRIVSLYGSRLQEDEELQNIINVIRGNGFSFVTLEKCLPDYKPGDSAAAFSECKQSSSGAPTIINRGFITLLTYLAH
ncbi:YB51 [Enterospora canceri]|uniref:YB51 n=1 Tax=Enterospora canceri TaxID=1081671 RepID=A0A1Y1S626_9MICR|nr:YB51 [Enterospora canceri]